MSKPFSFFCLGSMDCFPKAGNDSSSFLLDGHILIDTGYATVNDLLNHGIDPMDVDTILFTHLHFDHYAGLSAFLYYQYFHCYHLHDHLTVIAPPEQIDGVLDLAIDYFRSEDCPACDRKNIGMPNLIKLPERGTLNYGDYRIDCIPSIHAVPGRCYRITNADGHSVGLSGDTAYFPELETFFAGVDTLVFENSYATKEVEPKQKPGHSSAHDAGRVAAAAEAGRLVLVHSSHTDRDAAISCAGQYYHGPISYPVTGIFDEI